MSTPQSWVTLTDLGRRYGLSAVSCGRVLSEAGLRDADGLPNERAIREGMAFRRPEANANRSSLWHAERCASLFNGLGVRPLDDTRLVQQWAELLAALAEGSEAISTTPDQMAEDLPGHLVPAVNDRLQLLGVTYRLITSSTSGSAVGVVGRERATPSARAAPGRVSRAAPVAASTIETGTGERVMGGNGFCSIPSQGCRLREPSMEIG